MRFLLTALAVLLFTLTARAEPVDHSVTYQGELTDAGLPAAGDYDLRFRLFDAAAAGGQFGPALSVDGLRISDGRFTVVLDFGDQFGPDSRWLEIAVRRQGGSFTTVSPRQKIHAAPIALFALATPAQPHGVAEFLASTSWTVPAGVSSITVELWGGGPGVNEGVNGGSGAYVRAPIQTLPGSTFEFIVPTWSGPGNDGGDAILLRRTAQGLQELARAGGGHVFPNDGVNGGHGGVASGPAGSMLLGGLDGPSRWSGFMDVVAPWPGRSFLVPEGLRGAVTVQAGSATGGISGAPGHIVISW